ncbi:MAG: hypothetical protein WCF57_02165 [Pyrinomonadaceae bacterium]
MVREVKKAEAKPLKRGDSLFAGQRVSCATGCKELIISYCNVKVPVPRGPKGSLIVSINCGVLEGVRAGRPKGEGNSIISPKESELIQPETFVVRWKPSKSTIKLALKVYLGEKIWGPENIDGSKGLFKSDPLITALKIAQKAGDLHLVLILDDGNETMQRVKFDLISEADQQNVIKRLKAFSDETDRVLKALGRGMVFSEYELFSEAIEEFEKALAISQALKADKQNLIELRKLEIMANYKSYNDERVKQLCASSNLPVSSLPDVCSQSSP